MQLQDTNIQSIYDAQYCTFNDTGNVSEVEFKTAFTSAEKKVGISEGNRKKAHNKNRRKLHYLK